MKLYTKCGDKGTTSLIGGQRVAKDDLRVEAYGTVDELTANIAFMMDRLQAANTTLAAEHLDEFKRINSTLMDVEALLAVGEGGYDKVSPIDAQIIAWLEGLIDNYQSQTTPLKHFTIPGGCEIASLCHICRTVCRRAERCAIAAAAEYPIDCSAIIFLNRLSDYLYALGRYFCEKLGGTEYLWQK